MKIENKTVEDIIIIEIEGSIDSKTAPEFEASVKNATGNFKKVVVDLTKVDFCSSAGLRVLLLLYRNIKASNGQSVLTGVSDDIKEIMGDTGFIKFFAFSETVEAGIQTFK